MQAGRRRERGLELRVERALPGKPDELVERTEPLLAPPLDGLRGGTAHERIVAPRADGTIAS